MTPEADDVAGAPAEAGGRDEVTEGERERLEQLALLESFPHARWNEDRTALSSASSSSVPTTAGGGAGGGGGLDRSASVGLLTAEAVRCGRIVRIGSVAEEVSPASKFSSPSGGSPNGRCRSSSVLSPKAQAIQDLARARRLAEAKRVRQLNERPAFRPKLAPKARPGWNGRHKNIYENGGLHPNARSYFDRFLAARPAGEEPEKKKGSVTLSPSWRLEPHGPSQEERVLAATALKSMSPQVILLPSTGEGSPTRPQEGEREKPPSGQSERPWLIPPEPLDPDQEVSRPFPGGAGGEVSRLAAKEYLEAREEGQERKEGEAAAQWFEAPTPGSHAPQEAGSWDPHHHIMWCNEQKVGDFSRLNCMQFRSYFDRPLEPDVAARSRAMRRPRDDGPGDEINRIVPVWRLEPIPGRSGPTAAVLSEEDLRIEREMVKSRSGFGGAPQGAVNGSPGGFANSVSLSLPTSSRSFSSPSLGQELREQRWNWRHHNTFKNEEVSRLDRCYFDRYREAPCFEQEDDGSPQGSRTMRSSVRVWSLQPAGSPEETARQILESSDRRFKSDGKWDHRHHLTFDNRIHMNARSYFGRRRDPAPEGADPSTLEMTDPTTLPGPAHRDPTAASERRQRVKIHEDDRLAINWALQERPGPDDRDVFAGSLRAHDDDIGPGLGASSSAGASASSGGGKSASPSRRRRRREGWFSSHGVVF